MVFVVLFSTVLLLIHLKIKNSSFLKNVSPLSLSLSVVLFELISLDIVWINNNSPIEGVILSFSKIFFVIYYLPNVVLFTCFCQYFVWDMVYKLQFSNPLLVKHITFSLLQNKPSIYILVLIHLILPLYIFMYVYLLFFILVGLNAPARPIIESHDHASKSNINFFVFFIIFDSSFFCVLYGKIILRQDERA